MRQPNYHSHWREWMHSRRWIMNAQFQGIHSLNSCCWVLHRHVGFFYLFRHKFVVQPLWQYYYFKVSAKLWKINQQIQNIFIPMPNYFFFFSCWIGAGSRGGCVVESTDSSIDCHAWLLCPSDICFWYSIWHCKYEDGASQKISKTQGT